jgi:hypothetical protein
VVVSADDALEGKVDLDGLDSRYVFVYGTGTSLWEALGYAIRAANYVAKFGWRACGVGDGGILMEHQE